MSKPNVILALLCSALLFNVFTSDNTYNQSVKSSIILKTDTTTAGQKVSAFFSSPSEITGLKVTIPPGKETGWHKHTVPGMAYILKGTLTVETETGKKFEFKEGESFAEVIDMYHNGRNNGEDTVQLIAYFIGQKGKPITIKK